MFSFLTALLLILQPIAPDTPMTVRVGPDPVELTYTSTGDEYITITPSDLTDESALDLVLELWRDTERIAYHDGDAGTALENLLLTVHGDYTIVIDTFNGVQTGAVEVIITTRPRLALCEPGEIKLDAHMPYACLLELEADQRLTLSARDTSGTLDPVLRLFDADNDLLAFNDDHGTFSTALNVLDTALFDYPVMETGHYVVQISDFSGAAGTFELAVQIE